MIPIYAKKREGLRAKSGAPAVTHARFDL